MQAMFLMQHPLARAIAWRATRDPQPFRLKIGAASVLGIAPPTEEMSRASSHSPMDASAPPGLEGLRRAPLAPPPGVWAPRAPRCAEVAPPPGLAPRSLGDASMRQAPPALGALPSTSVLSTSPAAPRALLSTSVCSSHEAPAYVPGVLLRQSAGARAPPAADYRAGDAAARLPWLLGGAPHHGGAKFGRPAAALVAAM